MRGARGRELTPEAVRRSGIGLNEPLGAERLVLSTRLCRNRTAQVRPHLPALFGLLPKLVRTEAAAIWIRGKGARGEKARAGRKPDEASGPSIELGHGEKVRLKRGRL